jgi:serine/threonine protein phosphatase PrpC
MIEDGDVVALSTIGKRNSNLDKVKLFLIKFSYLHTKSCLLMGIFDGHGDDKVANHLQQYLLQRLSEH